jgi:RND family efflux transporter MFP subunit
MSQRLRAALGSVIFFLLLSPYRSVAAEEFPITDSQMKALAVTVQRLEQPRPIAGLTYPAQANLPRTAERVVSAPVDGMVSQVLVEENAQVKRGQPLLRFESPAFGALQLEVLEAAAEDRLAQQAYARAKELLAEGVVSQRRLDEAQAAADNARARLKHAKAAVRIAGADDASIERMATTGAVQDSLVITARQAGTVLNIAVKTGQRVTAGEVLARIGDVARLWLDIQVASDQVQRLQQGSVVAVVDRNVRARVVSIGAVVGESQTVMMRAEVVEGSENLRPGEFVTAMIDFSDASMAWALPLTAVVRRDQQAFVFVRTANGFDARPVNVVANAGQSVSVRGSLESGDAVAVTGVVALKAAWLGESGGD